MLGIADLLFTSVKSQSLQCIHTYLSNVKHALLGLGQTPNICKQKVCNAKRYTSIMYKVLFAIDISAEFYSKFSTCVVIMQYEPYVPLDNLLTFILSLTMERFKKQ